MMRSRCSFGRSVMTTGASAKKPRVQLERLSRRQHSSAPSAREVDGIVAMAALESVGRLPSGTSDRQSLLAAALCHPDDSVVKAAILKLDTTGGSDNPALRQRLAERAFVEPDMARKGTPEDAPSSIRWRGERSTSGP